MKHSIRYAVVIFLLTFAVSPFAAIAQTVSTDSPQTATTSQDGSSEPTSVRRERIRGYRQQSGELQQKINALGSTANSIVLMPILFGVEVRDISPNFGDPRDGGARTHEGEDIMALKGTPIVSPTPAVVLRTGVGTGEGNYVYTANPGGETFVYMHLDRIGEGVVSGAVLAQGSLIGYVGNTGNASGGAAHLHFEIHLSGNAIDPFPRLTGEFSIQEKISYLSTILLQTSDSTALARFLVTNFRGPFIVAIAANITLPVPIMDALASIPPATSASGAGGILPPGRLQVPPQPAGDLDIGSSGSAVVTLQKFLIQAASGAAATRLAGAGATGYFGIITKAALVEYQVSVGISPPSGYYGATTRAFVERTAPPAGNLGPEPGHTAPLPGNTDWQQPAAQGTGGGTAPLMRNLYKGISGEDVRTLQKLLNTHGYTVASSGAGSFGNETVYFGPATEAAVIKFQIARGITPAVGYVGPVTRAALASL